MCPTASRWLTKVFTQNYMNREPYIEQIHQYLSGELDAAARKSFEEALEKDEALKEAFLFEQQLLGALEQSFDQRAR